MAMRAERLQAGFEAWVDAREPELQRTAHLLTGDLATARAHVESVLAVLLGAARQDEADLDPLALRTLVAAIVSGRAPATAATIPAGVEVTLDRDHDVPSDTRHPLDEPRSCCVFTSASRTQRPPSSWAVRRPRSPTT